MSNDKVKKPVKKPAKKKAKAKHVGRKAWVPKKADFELVEAMAFEGVPLRHMAAQLGIGYSTLFEKINTYPELSETLQRGKAKGIRLISRKMLKKAQEGDYKAMTYYLNRADPAEFSGPNDAKLSGTIGVDSNASLITEDMTPEAASQAYLDSLNP